MFREIVTKAVIGKGKIANNSEIIVSVDKPISKVLGCWVINHVSMPSYENGSVFARGKYDLHIWYGCDEDKDTEIHKQTVDYVEEFKIKMKPGEEISEGNQLTIRSIKYPACSSLNLNDNGTISVRVEKELQLDVIGETVLKVQISQSSDEWFSDEDIGNINVDYMSGK